MNSLKRAGNRLAKAEAEREAAMAEVKKRVLEAHNAGLPKSTIAAFAGVSRQTVYTILKEN